MILKQLLFDRFLLVPPKRVDYLGRSNHLMNQIGFVKRRYGDFFCLRWTYSSFLYLKLLFYIKNFYDKKSNRFNQGGKK